MKWILFLLALICSVGLGSATNYYASVTGDNASDGLSVETAWQNVSYGVSQLTAGDTLYLINGTWYNEHAVAAMDGNSTHYISIKKYNGTPTLDGDDYTLNGGIGLDTDTYDYWKIDGITFKNYAYAIRARYNTNIIINCTAMSNIYYSTVLFDRCSNSTITNSTLQSKWNIVQVSGSDIRTENIKIIDNVFHDGIDHGMLDFMGNFTNILVENNIFYNNVWPAIYVHQTTVDGYPNSGYLKIYNNTIYNTSFGINFDDPVNNTIIRWNKIHDMFEPESRFGRPIKIVDPTWNVTISNNDIWGNAYGYQIQANIIGSILDSNNITATGSDVEFRFLNSDNVVLNTITNNNVYSVTTSAATNIEYTNGKVFTASTGNVKYYPTKSNHSFSTGTVEFTHYNITLIPSSGYLKDVVINNYNLSTEIYNLTINASVAENPTWINVTVANASNTYNISRDGVYYGSVVSDSESVVKYYYNITNDEWSEHTFEFTWSSELSASGTATITQIGDTIFIYGGGWADLTYITEQVSNTSAIQKNETEFLAGANIHVNDTTTTLFINNSDCTWLKLNSTFGDISFLRVNGLFEMNNSKITSWNTSSSSVDEHKINSDLDNHRAYMRFDNGVQDVHVNISNSNISYLGYNTSVNVCGLYFTGWTLGTIDNSVISYNYDTYMILSDDNIIQNTNIFNNSYAALDIAGYCNKNIFKNMTMYNNNHIAHLNPAYGGGGIRMRENPNDDNLFDAITIYNGWGGYANFQYGNNCTVRNNYYHSPTIANTRGLEFNGVTNSTAENNIVNGLWRGLYDVYGATNIFNNNTASNCTDGGLVIYGVVDGRNNVNNNIVFGNVYNILFTDNAENTTIYNTSITGAATSYDVYVKYTQNNTIQDLINYDDEFTIYMRTSNPSTYIDYSNGKIINTTTNPSNFDISNSYTSIKSSMFIQRTSDTSPYYITVHIYNGTLLAKTESVNLLAVNSFDEATGYNITINSTNSTEICTFTANVANATDCYSCYLDGVWIQNVQASNNIASWEYSDGFATEHILDIRWNGTAISTSTMTIHVDSWGMFNNWTSTMTFAGIAANESNDVCYTYYNVTSGLWESYYVGYSWNGDYQLSKDASVIGYFDAQTDITSNIITPSSTELYTGWNMLGVQSSSNQTISGIITDIGANCSDFWYFNSSTDSYSNTTTHSIQPNQGFLAYITQTMTWTRSAM